MTSPARFTLIALVLPAIVATSLKQTASFEEYVHAMGRTYSPGSVEWGERRDLFEQRAEAVRVQNSKPDKLWTAALNLLTDRTELELAKMRGWSRVADGPGAPGGHTAGGSVSFLAESSRLEERLPKSV